jgi:hypothetical protein
LAVTVVFVTVEAYQFVVNALKQTHVHVKALLSLLNKVSNIYLVYF